MCIIDLIFAFLICAEFFRPKKRIKQGLGVLEMSACDLFLDILFAFSLASLEWR